MITPASSRALRAALASKPASTVYAGVTAVRMASTGVTHREARYPMHTATFKAVDFDGKPAPHAVVLYLNTTDSTKTVGIGFANYLGQFKASVAEGTYQLVTTGFDYRPGARPAGAIATSPEFRIDAGHTDGTVDLRSATTPVRTTVFKPVDHPFLVTSLSRGPSDGSGGIGVTLMNGLDAVVRVTPTRGALHGEQTLPWLLAATGHDATGEYRIGVGNDRSGRIPATPIAWHYGPAQVVTRDNGLQDPTQARFITSVRAGSIGAGIAVPLPGRLTESSAPIRGSPWRGSWFRWRPTTPSRGGRHRSGGWRPPGPASPRPGTGLRCTVGPSRGFPARCCRRPSRSVATEPSGSSTCRCPTRSRPTSATPI